MHVYIYDDFINKKKHENILANIETRITDLGLNGKIIRLGVMKNAATVIESETKRGAKTIVAVGSDQTVSKIMNAMIRAKSSDSTGGNIPLGIIPIGQKENTIAQALGIKSADEACDTLSGRRIEKLDVGQAMRVNAQSKVSANYFLSQATIVSRGTTLEIDKNYSIELMEAGAINIINLNTFADLPENISPDPRDGLLELYIRAKGRRKIIPVETKTTQSFFSLKKLTITNKESPVILDNALPIPAPVEINVIKKYLNIIVGKERSF